MSVIPNTVFTHPQSPSSSSSSLSHLLGQDFQNETLLSVSFSIASLRHRANLERSSSHDQFAPPFSPVNQASSTIGSAFIPVPAPPFIFQKDPANPHVPPPSIIYVQRGSKPLITIPTPPRLKGLLSERLCVDTWIESIAPLSVPGHIPWGGQDNGLQIPWIAEGKILLGVYDVGTKRTSKIIDSFKSAERSARPRQRNISTDNRLSLSGEPSKPAFREALVYKRAKVKKGPLSRTKQTKSLQQNDMILSADELTKRKPATDSCIATAEVSLDTTAILDRFPLPPTPTITFSTSTSVIPMNLIPSTLPSATAPLAIRRGRSLPPALSLKIKSHEPSISTSMDESFLCPYPDVPTPFRGSPPALTPPLSGHRVSSTPVTTTAKARLPASNEDNPHKHSGMDARSMIASLQGKCPPLSPAEKGGLWDMVRREGLFAFAAPGVDLESGTVGEAGGAEEPHQSGELGLRGSEERGSEDGKIEEEGDWAFAKPLLEKFGDSAKLHMECLASQPVTPARILAYDAESNADHDSELEVSPRSSATAKILQPDDRDVKMRIRQVISPQTPSTINSFDSQHRGPLLRSPESAQFFQASDSSQSQQQLQAQQSEPCTTADVQRPESRLRKPQALRSPTSPFAPKENGQHPGTGLRPQKQQQHQQRFSTLPTSRPSRTPAKVANGVASQPKVPARTQSATPTGTPILQKQLQQPCASLNTADDTSIKAPTRQTRAQSVSATLPSRRAEIASTPLPVRGILKAPKSMKMVRFGGIPASDEDEDEEDKKVGDPHTTEASNEEQLSMGTIIYTSKNDPTTPSPLRQSHTPCALPTPERIHVQTEVGGRSFPFSQRSDIRGPDPTPPSPTAQHTNSAVRSSMAARIIRPRASTSVGPSPLSASPVRSVTSTAPSRSAPPPKGRSINVGVSPGSLSGKENQSPVPATGLRAKLGRRKSESSVQAAGRTSFRNIFTKLRG